jgi:DNA-directed RNA polymerase specialized sigma24 family protein
LAGATPKERDAVPTVTPPGLSDKFWARIQELEPDIQRMVRHWSWDCPDSWEDLAQEARLAIYLQLKQDPETPRNHLMQHAKSAILHYRQRGRSVDGKLNRIARRSHV